jgi:hypothetical protein
VLPAWWCTFSIKQSGGVLVLPGRLVVSLAYILARIVYVQINTIYRAVRASVIHSYPFVQRDQEGLKGWELGKDWNLEVAFQRLRGGPGAWGVCERGLLIRLF